MAGINERLRDTNAIYLDGTTVPADTTTTSSRLKTGEGGLLGSNIGLVIADTAISVGTAATFTLSVDDNILATGGTNTNVLTKLIAGGLEAAAGDTVAEFVLPRTVKEYTSVTVGTDDAGATGTLSTFLSSPMGRTNV